MKMVSIKNIGNMMGKNILWYLPLCIVLFVFAIVPPLMLDYHTILLIRDRFDWGIFISASTALYAATLFSTPILQIFLICLIPTFFENKISESYGRRYRYSFFAIVGVLSIIFVHQFLIWGSFPLPSDKEGYIHIRMIPFIPWPEESIADAATR